MGTKKLADADFETGIAFEQRLAAALKTLNDINAGYQVYVAILRERYEAPAPLWTMHDWAEGFVSNVVTEEGNGNDG